MQTPLELTFRHMEPTPEIEALVHEKVARLEKLYSGITSCHVYVQAPHQRRRHGNLYEVTVELRVPGDTLSVHQTQHDVAEHEHPKVAIRDSFAAMERRLKQWKDAVSGEEKTHEGMLQGKIVELHTTEGYGQILATDGRLVYFHRNSVVDSDFDDMRVGDAVELVAQTDESEIGPQASTVRRIGAMKYAPR